MVENTRFRTSCLCIYICIVSVFLVTLFCCGCDNDKILGYQPKTSLEIYDTFWSDMNDHYAVFEQRGVDWSDVNARYRSMIDAETTSDELWAIFSSITTELNDAHTYLYDFDNRRITPNGYSQRDSQVGSGVDAILENRRSYIVSDLSYGKVAGENIGYISVATLLDYDIAAIDRLVAKVAECDAFIIDLRECQGGSGVYAVRLASYFVDNEVTEMYYRIKSGPEENQFSELVANPHYINRSVSYADRPVVVLTSAATVSAGEWLTAILKTSANVTQIGVTTNGSLSVRSLQRYLPNGWLYYYSNTLVTLADGRSLEGVGCEPDIEVVNMLDVDDYTDYMLRAAIDFLTDEAN